MDPIDQTAERISRTTAWSTVDVAKALRNAAAYGLTPRQAEASIRKAASAGANVTDILRVQAEILIRQRVAPLPASDTTWALHNLREAFLNALPILRRVLSDD